MRNVLLLLLLWENKKKQAKKLNKKIQLKKDGGKMNMSNFLKGSFNWLKITFYSVMNMQTGLTAFPSLADLNV